MLVGREMFVQMSKIIPVVATMFEQVFVGREDTIGSPVSRMSLSFPPPSLCAQPGGPVPNQPYPSPYLCCASYVENCGRGSWHMIGYM